MQVALTYALVAIQIAENVDHPGVTNSHLNRVFSEVSSPHHTPPTR